MKQNNFIKIVILLGSVLLCLYSYALDIPKSITDSREIISIQDSLKQIYASVLNESEILAQRIKLYRSKETLSTREHRHVQKLLKEAQQLTLHKNDISKQMHVLANQLDLVLFDGLEEIHKKLESLTSKNHNESFIAADVKTINQYLSWKAELESYQRLYKPSPQNELSLYIQKDDSQSDLQLKGDIILDREDQFRAEIVLIDQRIQSLKIEADVRRKVRDVSAELELFNEDEELLTRTVPVYSEDYPYNNMSYWDYTESRIKLNGSGETYSLSETIESNDAFQYLRTPEMIEQAIEKLIIHKSRLHTIADSLHQTAEIFYQKASEREDAAQ